MSYKQQAVAAVALQYSKWLSKFICWVWAIYRFTIIAASAIVPAAASSLVSTVGTLDTIMMINVATYMCNSLGEKLIYSDKFVLSAFNKGWFKSLFRGVKTIVENEDEDEELIQEQYDEDLEVSTDEGEGNG